MSSFHQAYQTDFRDNFRDVSVELTETTATILQKRAYRSSEQLLRWGTGSTQLSSERLAGSVVFNR